MRSSSWLVVVFSLLQACSCDPAELAALLRANVHSKHPVDCFGTFEDFRFCCCGSDADLDLACWVADRYTNWHLCCAHLVSECPSEGPQDNSVALADDSSCWSPTGMLSDPFPLVPPPIGKEQDGQEGASVKWQPFAMELCCDTSLGAGGLADCWHPESGQSFSQCCGLEWRARRSQGCTDELLQDVWIHVRANTTHTYLDLINGNAYHALYRIVRQALNGLVSTVDDAESRPSSSDIPCLLAFVCTRIMALSKMPWEVQWPFLMAPHTHVGSGHISERAVFLSFKILFQIPLQHLVVEAPHWSQRLLLHIVKHSRKFRNYLLPDMLPFPASSGFPRSDVGMMPDAQVFCDLANYHLNRGNVVDEEVSRRFIKRTSEAYLEHSGWALPAHMFSLVMAHLALAHALLSKSKLRHEALAEIAAGDVIFRRFLAQWSEDHGHLLFTEWPFWSILLIIVEKIIASSTSRAAVDGTFVPRQESAITSIEQDIEPTSMFLASCIPVEGLREHQLQQPRMQHEDRGGRCRDVLLSALRSQEAKTSTFVGLLSPFLQRWSSADASALRSAQVFLRLSGASIAGLAFVDAARLWNWPVRRMRHAFWRLRYEPYPTGHALALGSCAGGDATSATRVYRTSLLLRLLESIGEDPGDRSGANLFVELDLLAFRLGVPAYTCSEPPLEEHSSYLEHFVLTPRFAVTHSVEAFEPNFQPMDHIAHLDCRVGSRQVLCWTASKFTDPEAQELVQNGMASRFCYRRRLQRLGLGRDLHRVMPKQGTLLTTLVRGGEFGTMPWDLDLEFVLATIGTNPILSSCNTRHVGEGWEDAAMCVAGHVRAGLNGTRVVVKEFLKPVSKLLFEKYGVLGKVRLEVDGVLDLQFDEMHGPLLGMRKLHKAFLLGVQVDFSWHQWEYQLFQIYGGSLQKKVGTSGTVSKSEACPAGSQHSACLRTTCTPDREDGCNLELPDWFAHVLPG
mmetsp:Transcript_168098/g.534828  ORF Transcript_168098/g.534828 Transcript_168098/m.534828 type:complete len:964 (-) Transcript_168098:166-3057(-)